MSRKSSATIREIRHKRVRRRVVGSQSRPRLCVYRSLSHIYAQLVDDSSARTLVSMCTLDAAVRTKADVVGKTGKAEAVGTLLAEKALEQGIRSVVFDRGGHKYHGRVKALAEAARKAGLEF